MPARHLRQLNQVLCAVLLLAGACIRRPAPVAGPSPVTQTALASLTILPFERHQSIEGFGASLAWYQDRLVPNPPPGIYQMLFPDLGLDILRLRPVLFSAPVRALHGSRRCARGHEER